MPNNQKATRSTVRTEQEVGLAPPEIVESASPVLPLMVPGIDSAPGRQTSNNCRECLAATAHRLAQCATALRGGMELALLGKHTGAEYVSILEESLQLADHMVQMIVSLRDLAESSAPAGPPQSVALESLVREVQSEMQGLADARGIQFRLIVEGSIHANVNPGRLREALQNLLVWIIENSAGGDFIETAISNSNGEVHLSLTPPRMDLQYLQIKVLEDLANPGLLFSHAAKNATMGWAINRRLFESLGGKLEIVSEGANAACIRVRMPSSSAL